MRPTSMETQITLKQVLVGGLAVFVLAATFAIGILIAGRPSAAAALTLPAAQDASSTAVTPGITVTGSSDVSAVPDTLVMDVSVSATGDSVDAAMSSANGAAGKVQAALKGRHVAPKDMQTSGLSIDQQYDKNGQPNGRYVVNESLTVKIRDLKSAGASISAVTAAGGNATRINGIRLALDDDAKAAASGRDAAVADAKAKAEQYAKAAGRSLGQLVSLTEQVSAPAGFSSDSSMKAAAAQPVPIQAGSQQLTVSVTAIYALG